MNIIVAHDQDWNVWLFTKDRNSCFATYAFTPIGNWPSLVAPRCSKPDAEKLKPVPFVYLQNVRTTDLPVVHK